MFLWYFGRIIFQERQRLDRLFLIIIDSLSKGDLQSYGWSHFVKEQPRFLRAGQHYVALAAVV